MKLQQKSIEKLQQLINEETEYRTGPTLVAFFNEFGFKDSYGQGFPSRWFYTEDKLKSINGTSKIEECIKKIFSPINFIGKTEILDKHILDFNQFLAFDGYKIFKKGKEILINKSTDTNEIENNPISEDEFIAKEFKKVSLEELKLDPIITEVLRQRLEEIRKCLNAKAPLAVVFLCGSTLEGILLGIASKYPQKFNQSKCAYKKDGKVLPFPEWNLSSLIDSSRDIGILGEDVKKYSHALRDFRNYIHPYQQMSSNFDPNDHTAKISWQVLQAAIFEIAKFK